MTVSEAGLRYQRFIDDFVELSRTEVAAELIRRNGHCERTNDNEVPLETQEIERKEFFLSLTDNQREIIAEMLDDARISAIHDVLALMEWRYTSGELVLTVDGLRFPEGPFWGTMHMNYVCRRNNDPWPQEN